MVSSLLYLLAALWRHEPEGQGLVEYALILIMVSVVLIVLLVVLGPGLGNIYSTIISAV
jgi:pilus assembly protein Flp/PilA